MKRERLGRLSLLCLCMFTVATFHCETASSKEKDRKYFENRGDVVWEVPTDNKVIAITFDDGPNEEFTPQVMALLQQHRAKATFFVVGSRVHAHPLLAKQIVENGHEIANHTYSHPNMTRLSMERFINEMERTQNAIVSATGQKARLFRPPGGHYNERIVNTVKNAGYMMVMWSWHQDTRDWSDPGVSKIVNKVLNNARNGDIVLFHDHGGDRRQTIASLMQILPELEKRGYRFVTVSELLHMQKKIHVVDPH